MLDFKSFDISTILIYHIISLFIFGLGFFLIYLEKQSSTFSSILISIGWFLLRILPFYILFWIALESELTFKSESLQDYITNINVYAGPILVLIFLSSLGIFAQILSYSFNFNGMQDPLSIPEFMRQQKCGALCFVDIKDTLFLSRGKYQLLDIGNFLVNSVVLLIPFILFISTFLNNLNLGYVDALLSASVRFIPVFIFAIFVLLGTFTNFKETLEFLDKDGYYGGIVMNVVNMGFFYLYFGIMTVFYFIIPK